jgi:hypothetical protein
MSGLVLEMSGRAVTVGLMGKNATMTLGAAHVEATEGLKGIIDALTDPFPAAVDFCFKDHPAMTDIWSGIRQPPQESN